MFNFFKKNMRKVAFVPFCASFGKILGICLLLLARGLFSEQICIFTPPKGWKLADQKLLAKEVLVAFWEKGKFLASSINLAHEKLDIPFEQYIKEVSQLHLKDRIINLGTIETKSGKAQLFSFINKTAGGEMELLQAILPGKKEVFVLTAAAEKCKFLAFKDKFVACIKSLQLVDDLFSITENKEELKRRFDGIREMHNQKEREKRYKEVEKYLLSNFDDFGDYWKMLMLKEAYKASL